MQVHGGTGYIEETGAAQHYRDARIAAIYEGTNGIQAIDLVNRKLTLNDGATVEDYIHDLCKIVQRLRAANDPAFGASAARLSEALDALEAATHWLIAQLRNNPRAALAGATPYLRLFGIAAGGCLLANEALASIRINGNGDAATATRIGLARFFAEQIAVQGQGLELAIVKGASSVLDTPLSGD